MVSPVPEVIDTLPPTALALFPPLTTISPPFVVCASPASMEIEPATPELEVSPVVNEIEPVLAWFDTPVLMSIAPDEPPLPAFWEEIKTSPLADDGPPSPL